MKKLILYKKFKAKSSDVNHSSKSKYNSANNVELNNTFTNNISSIYDDINRKNKTKKEEISILSNANLNILKKLTTYAKEEILNNSSDFPSANKKHFFDLKSLDSLTKIKHKIINSKKSFKRKIKKNLNKNSKIIASNYSSQLSLNSHKIMNNLKIKEKFSLHNKSMKKHRKRNSMVHMKNNYMSEAFLNDVKEEKLINLKNISNKNLEINYEMKTKINYEKFMNEIEIMKINNNLRKDIHFIKLKNKISKLKDSFQSVQNKNNFNQNSIEKFRILKKKKMLYDSLDEEDYEEELLGFYISPDSWYIQIFDIVLLLLSISYSIFVPFLLSINYFSKNDNKILNYIFILIDVVYIVDCFLCLFKGYKNFYEHLIIKPKKIMRHYLKTWFVIDFLQAIPFFTFIIYNIFSFKFNLDYKLEIILLLKVIKLYKLFYYNYTISHISEIITSNELIDNYGGFILVIFIILIILNITSCLFIFIGKNSYPGWIIKINIQDENYIVKYLTSIYFIIVTITSVGYGDITGITNSELLFQIYLLIIGTIAYSFTISYISNMIVKTNEKSKNFEKNMEIINEVKLNHPHMKTSLYNELLRNVYNMKLYEKKDKHILLDSLPYSLKNILIINMNKNIIDHFIFFKNIDNSGFIIKVVNSFVPIISIKDDIILQEGDYIKEIIFIKKGLISLNINFDLNDIESSLNKYIYKNQIGKINIHFLKNSNFNNKKLLLNKSLDSSYSEINLNPNKNILEVKIVEIRNNEHFGDALMFLNERSPLNAIIRTKSAELLMLRKIEAIEIYSLYPNIWKRINKISLYNMDQIYLKIKKYVIKFAKINKMDINKIINKRKRNIHKKIKFNEKSIYNNSKKNLFESNKNSNNEKIISNEINQDLNQKEQINIKNQSTNSPINLFHSKEKNFNHQKRDNINLTDIKSYFQSSSDIYKEKVLNTEIKENLEENKNSSISPCLSKLSDQSIVIKIDKMKEKLIYNSFINLKQIKQTNFHINSSYENINKLSNDKYIKDLNLQLKITNILKFENKENNNNVEKITYLNFPKTTTITNKKATFNTILFNNINTEKEEMTHKSSSKLPSFFDENYERFHSNKNLLDNINRKAKLKRSQTKKKTNKINRQLNIITKNIENTSININNPDKYYSNFFKNIIDKKTQIVNTNSNNNTKIETKNGTSLFKYYMKDKSINNSDNKEEIHSEK